MHLEYSSHSHAFTTCLCICEVRDWLEVRLSGALRSQQPLVTAVELVQGAKDFPNVDGGSVVRSLLPEVEPWSQVLVAECYVASVLR